MTCPFKIGQKVVIAQTNRCQKERLAVIVDFYYNTKKNTWLFLVRLIDNRYLELPLSRFK